MTAAFTAVFLLSIATIWTIKQTVGLRVSPEVEDAGLDIAEHGMYGYPEQFIPQPEFAFGLYEPKVAGTPIAPHTSSPIRAMATENSA